MRVPPVLLLPLFVPLLLPPGSAHAAAERPVPCLIEPHARISLRSAVSALITQVHVDRGSLVRKGQLLVSLDASAEQAALESARYRAVMEGQLQAAQSRMTHLNGKLGRREALLAQRFISEQERDDTANEARIAAADALEAKDNRTLAQIEARRLSAQVARHSLLSPVSGIVTERLQHPGEMAQVGDAAQPILKLAQIDPLRVELIMPVARYGQFKPGDQVEIKPEPPFPGSYKAVVRVVDLVVDPASGTFGVRLELPNPKGDIPAGVRCTAAL